jgi:hypothetical protein
MRIFQSEQIWGARVVDKVLLMEAWCAQQQGPAVGFMSFRLAQSTLLSTLKAI